MSNLVDTSGSQYKDLLPIIESFLDTETWEHAQRLIEKHAELLSSDADGVLANLASKEEEEETRQIYEEHRALLQQCREMGIAQAFENLAHRSRLEDVITDFINADAWLESRHILNNHPELLSDEADTLFIRLMQRQQDSDARDAVEAHRLLLKHCRDIGISAAFAEIRKKEGNREEPPEDLHPLLIKINQLTGQHELPHRISLYRQALEKVDQDEYPKLWAGLQQNLSNSLVQTQSGDQEANLELAINHGQQATQVFTQAETPFAWAQVMSTLASAYFSRIHGDRTENLEQAIRYCQQALQVLTQNDTPNDWAAVVHNLANVYSSRIGGERAENLEQAILYYQQALQVFSQNDTPVEWAAAMHNLATVYFSRIRGERAENLEQAIQHYQQALQIRTKDKLPVERALTLHNLARTYHLRIQGERAENLEQAILYYIQARQILTQSEEPVEWSLATHNLADAYTDRILGKEAENLELAVQYFKQALGVRTREGMPVEWAETVFYIGVTYANRIVGDRAENLELAIQYFQQALQVQTKDEMPVAWSQTIHQLADAYAVRIQGSQAENLERAIDYYQQALQIMTKDQMPIDWARIKHSLADAYMDRIRGERAENLELAIRYYQHALQITTQDEMPVDWAETVNNLANAYHSRITGEKHENLQLAIETCYQALQVFTQDQMPSNWAMTMVNLANAYYSLDNEERGENLELAISYYEEAIHILSKDEEPATWSQAMHNLGSAYYSRTQGQPAENMEIAIKYYQQALQVRTKEEMPAKWATTQDNLGVVYTHRSLGERNENLQRAIQLYRQILQVITPEAFPRQYRNTQYNLGEACLKTKQWSTAIYAFQSALLTAETLYTAAATPEARRAELREIRSVPSQMAYAWIQQTGNDSADLAEVVIVLERNRARWLAESISVRSAQPAGVPNVIWNRFTETAIRIQELQAEAQLSDKAPNKRNFLILTQLLSPLRRELDALIEQIRSHAPHFMPQPSLPLIQSALTVVDTEGRRGVDSGSGVYLIATEVGGVALVVHKHSILPIRLNGLTDDAIRDTLDRWLTAYFEFVENNEVPARQNWFAQMDTTTRQLWDMAVGPIAVALDNLGLKCVEHPHIVTLIPIGWLALLPWHLAWTDDATASSGRRYFLDNVAVRYAPSATALHYCKEQADDVQIEQILAIDEPKPVTVGKSLPYSSREVNSIISLFPDPKLLQHQQATRTAAQSALSAAHVAHFSCHGTNNWENALDSGLLFANNELLTVRDFLGFALPNARLATFSACETGIVGTELPDEVIMLPSALVQAGYAGVISSLWSVAEIATTMLMIRFYHNWREARLDPIFALRLAQCWLRETTAAELNLAEWFKNLYDVSGRRDREAFQSWRYYQTHPEERPFQHPYYWGGFYLTGT